MEGNNSMGLGFMAAFAVSGSVVLIARQVYKRLLSEFMEKIEYELRGTKKCQGKKRVRFADNVVEPSSDNDQYRRRHLIRLSKDKQEKENTKMVGAVNHDDHGANLMGAMPLNWQILYKGIIEYKTLKGYDIN